jgi:hypothetical protein
MGDIIQENQEFSDKKDENENLRKIWQEIDGSIVYYVKIGIPGDTVAAKIEDREGIAYKKTKESLVFTHGKTEIEIPITENIKFSEYPGGNENIPDCLGISIHSNDFLIVASIEFSAGKTAK